VIEGRLGLLVLDKEFDVRIFLTGTKDDRISHMASRRGIAVEKASKVVDSSDRERRALVEKLFDHELELNRFDLVINTSSYGFDKSVSLINTILQNHARG
jgi:cytidylate kinase